MDFKITIQIISVLGILVPIVIGIVNYKTAELDIQLFLVFLSIGFFVDSSMISLALAGKTAYLQNIFDFYSLVESTFFYWLISRNVKRNFLQVASKILLLVTPVFWNLVIIARTYPLFKDALPVKMFDPVYEIAVAFLSGIVLLQMVETGSVFSIPVFWLFQGMFFYCFCTFFIMMFLNTVLSQHIWFMANIINIISYIFYSIGLSKTRELDSRITR